MSRKRWGASVLLAGALSLVAGAVAPPAQAHQFDRARTVGYYTQWSIYARNVPLRNLVVSGAAAKLTTLNYAFGFLDAQGNCVSADPWADFQRPFPAADSVNGQADQPGQPLAGNLNQLRLLKQKFPKLRINISIGGWTGSKYFSDAALTPQSRAASVKSCLDQWLKGDIAGPGVAAGIFDGIDIDWEWPGSEGNTGNVIRPQDKQNFTKLLLEYRIQLFRLGLRTHRSYDLTAFLPANPVKLDAGFETAKVFSLLTFGTIQGYDFHGTWEPTTNQQSALRSPAADPTKLNFSDQTAIDAVLSRGAPRDKVVMGVPFYSHGWTGVTNKNAGLFQPSTGPAPATFEAGTEDYKALKDLVTAGKFKVYRDERSGHAWIFDGSTFWTYDDPVEMKRKARFITDRRLGGAMIWSLDGDTANGELISALHNGLRH
ncbi:glycoside hydrolase family 18 protein [Actinocrispum wychmicini]|uniref:chitinase n=1 Tax=Actinocrispum wychmicini TaxID=1213861 RepID=A0A4R2JLS6_9PSEU|nr:glycoside hydrolase family 18 protein [Actinocrispum wychmicini]TCO61023.1 chitinase [Actinocrispum wychmicini]